MQFLTNILGRKNLIAFGRFLGYCLLRDQRFKKGFFFVGPTDTGKTELLELVLNFVGRQYVTNTPLHQLEESRWYRAQLFGKLIGYADDLPFTELADCSVFKRITGGSEIDGEFKNKQPFDFRPTAKLLFTANEMPDTKIQQEAYFNRVAIFPCENRIPEKDKKDDIAKELSTPENMRYLLSNVLIELPNLVKKRDFCFSEASTRAQENYKFSQNSILYFVKERCYREPEAEASKDQLYSEYQDFCADCDAYPKSRNIFFKRLYATMSSLNSLFCFITSDDR